MTYRFTLTRKAVDILFGYDVFISYAHDDGADYAEALWGALSERLTVHLDTREIHAGDDLDLVTRIRVRNSNLLVVVGRPAALCKSRWVAREVREFLATGRLPVIIDVDGAAEAAITKPEKGYLSEWLSEQRTVHADGSFTDRVLKVSDVAPTRLGTERRPSLQTISKVLASFTGVRVATRRRRWVSATILLLTVLALGFAWQWRSAVEAARIARAEALGNAAVAATAGADLTNGFLGDALAYASESLTLAETSGVLQSASTVEGAIPLNLTYAEERMNELREAVISGEALHVLESNDSVLTFDLDTLALVDRWSAADHGLIGISGIAATHDGFLSFGRGRLARVTNGETIVRDANLWGGVADTDAGITIGFDVPGGTARLLPAVGAETAFPCAPSELSVSSVAKFGPNQFVVAGNRGSSPAISIVDAVECTNRTAVGGPNSTIAGFALPGVGKLIHAQFGHIILYDTDSFRPVSSAAIHGLASVAPLKSRDGSTEGVAAGLSDGTVRLYTVTAEGALDLSDTSPRLLPGTIEAIAVDPNKGRLYAAGKKGFFVGAEKGALVSLGFETELVNGIRRLRFSSSAPGHRLSDFPSPHSIVRSAIFGSGFVVEITSGALLYVDNEGRQNRITPPDLPVNTSIAGLATSAETIYLALSSGAAGWVVSLNSRGQILEEHLLSFSPSKIAASPAGVFVFGGSSASPKFQRISVDGTVLDLSTIGIYPAHDTLFADPTGRSIAIARADGFEVRDARAPELPSDCRLSPRTGKDPRAGVVASFSANGDSLLLGSWEGELAVYERARSCWRLRTKLASEVGTMIPTVFMDDAAGVIIGRRLRNPPLLQRWDARTGAEIGRGYTVDARAIGGGGHQLLLLQERGVVRLDLSAAAIRRRLCGPLTSAIKGALVERNQHWRGCATL